MNYHNRFIRQCAFSSLCAIAILFLSACKVENVTQTDVVHCPTDLAVQEDMLRLVNKARSQARLCGDEGRFDAANSITWNVALQKAAKVHSDDMGRYGTFSHTGSDGSQPWNRALAQGYEYEFLEENIAKGYDMSAQKVVNMWLTSPGHCANIMNKDITEMGVACTDKKGRDATTYWTQVFGKPE